jgi:membrane-associated phospholipid phosphatase
VLPTGVLLWLQAGPSDGLSQVARWISEAGASRIYLAALIVVGFAGDLAMSLALAQGLLWNLVLVGCLKNWIALPRPGDFDPPITGLRRLGWPAADAVTAARLQVTAGYGFPSGHASNATVLWGGVAIHARSAAAWVLAITLVLAVCVSRVQIGQHFVGDVVGGILTGSIVLAVTSAVFLRGGARVWSGRGNRWLTPLAAASAVLPAVILALRLGSNPTALGRLTGFDCALLLLMRTGLPSDPGGLLQRALRVLLAFGLYAGSHHLLARALAQAGLAAGWAEYAAAAAATFALLAGTVRLSEALGLYQRAVAPARITAPTASPG